jgi:hypothetical protein
VIGVAGTAYIQSRYPYWVAAKSPFIHGQVIHHNKQLKLSRYSDAVGDQPVVAVDGLLMAVSKETFRKHRFDAKTFDGFHFYDIDFSVRASEDSKMLVTTDILTKHLSGGSFNDSWKQYRDRFRKKYDQRRIWSCVQGQPNSDSHLQRLNCHYPLNEFFDQVTVEKFEKLGKEHPKHPGFELVNSESK